MAASSTINLFIQELAARFDEQQATETMLQNQLKRLGVRRGQLYAKRCMDRGYTCCVG